MRRIVQVILDIRKEIHEKHLKRFLDRCLWQFTEAEGKHKYDLRYVSEAALPLLHAENRSKLLRHDHIRRRGDMVNLLIAHPEQADSILDATKGCVVTIDEHKKLGQVDRHPDSVNGWERYQRAKLKVHDRSLGRIVSFDELMRM